MNPSHYDYITYTCAVVGLSAIVYFVYTEIKEWLDQKRQYKAACATATQNYIQSLHDKIGQLETDLRASVMRELGYLNERKVTSARMAFMAQEISMDDMDKKTRVLSR
jgi:hypothetical protein